MNGEDNFKTSCGVCGDSGMIFATSKANGSLHAFRCGVCQSGANKGISEKIPLWTNAAKVKFDRQVSVLCVKGKEHQK